MVTLLLSLIFLSDSLFFFFHYGLCRTTGNSVMVWFPSSPTRPLYPLPPSVPFFLRDFRIFFSCLPQWYFDILFLCAIFLYCPATTLVLCIFPVLLSLNRDLRLGSVLLEFNNPLGSCLSFRSPHFSHILLIILSKFIMITFQQITNQISSEIVLLCFGTVRP